MVQAWYLADELADPRQENRRSPNEPCNTETLVALGLRCMHFGPHELSDDVEAFVRPLLRQLHYSSFDIVTISPQTFGDRFEALAATHFREHLHEDEEARMILDGIGYFDVRDAQDRWIRVETSAGDCVVLPAGIYHRFITTPSKYIKTLRLFKENPKWVAVPRDAGLADGSHARKVREQYEKGIAAPAATIVGAAEGEANGIYSIADPLKFDDALTAVAKAHHRDMGAAVVYITGAVDPATGESWCPDCVRAKPAVAEGYHALRRRHANERVLFIECPVERSTYRGNPKYPYRTHPLLRVTGVPTVLVLTPKKKLPADVESCHGWTELLDLHARTEEPDAKSLSNL